MRAVSSGESLPFREEVDLSARGGGVDLAVALAAGEVLLGPEESAERVSERDAPRVLEALRAAVAATGGRLEILSVTPREGRVVSEALVAW